MKLKHIFIFISGFSLVIILLLVSCQSEMKPTIATLPTVVATNTVISQSTLESATTSSLMPTVTAIVMIDTTSDPVPDFTALGTPVSETPTLATPTIIMPTLTPLPTLEAEELETAVAELLTNPMNCDLPCWWGAVPGITSLNEIKHTISPYNFDIYEHVDGQFTILRLGIGHVEERNDFEIRIGYGFTNSILTTVSAYSPPISELLVKYGLPDEIWLSAMNDPREQPPLMWFTIVYLQKGMGIGYVVDGNIQGDMMIGCVAFEGTERLRRLRLITPVTDNTISYKDFPGTFDEQRLYLPLEVATGLTIDEFMVRFSDPSQPQCIETPIELWE